jgi:hypothetical protein
MIDIYYGINNKAILDVPTKLMHIAAFLYSDLNKKFHLLKLNSASKIYSAHLYRLFCLN